MAQSIATFMDACYIACQNAISSLALEHLHTCVGNFHALHNIFIESGVRATISLPCQHALHHYYQSIKLFSSPNGLCSSIMESKHIKAVKEPWQCSSKYNALHQMLRTLSHLKNLAFLHQKLTMQGLLTGTTSSFFESLKASKEQGASDDDEWQCNEGYTLPCSTYSRWTPLESR